MLQQIHTMEVSNVGSNSDTSGSDTHTDFQDVLSIQIG